MASKGFGCAGVAGGYVLSGLDRGEQMVSYYKASRIYALMISATLQPLTFVKLVWTVLQF